SPLPRGHIIVFPGSFNPPTIAHIALLKQARRFSQQSQQNGQQTYLYAAISKRIVDKEKVERPLLVDRIDLLTQVLHRRVDDAGILLFNRGLYVEQAEAVHASFPRVRRLLFLLGFDKIVQILDPHYYDDRDASLKTLFSMSELLVASRGKDGEQELNALIHKPENEQFARYIHPLPFDMHYRNISSTKVREGVATTREDVPREVQEFIRKTRAYAKPIRMPDGSEYDYYGERMKMLERLLR
ncbi:MAG TPA: hypothetical protein DHW02_11150, partial [Ktedonobacter sp.]|nr:hypothetical protein [Ktedonobacter sp.]